MLIKMSFQHERDLETKLLPWQHHSMQYFMSAIFPDISLDFVICPQPLVMSSVVNV